MRDLLALVDNMDLAKGNRVAIVVTGIARPDVFEHALSSLQKNVVDAMGRDRVHVFVHAEPLHAALGIAGVEKMLRHELHPSALKGHIIVPAGSKGESMAGTPPWTMLTGSRVQFDRVRDAFQLVVAEEQRNGERYAWVCRVRTDAIWLTSWDADQMRQLVPESTVAGSAFHHPGHRSDKFWIASRDAAWRVFVLLPTFFFLNFSTTEMWETIGCDERRPHDDFLVPRQHLWPRRTLFLNSDSRGCECIYQEPLLCPEVIIPFAFISMGLHLTDSCRITGRHLTIGNHNPFEVTCKPGPDGETLALERRTSHSEHGLVSLSLWPEPPLEGTCNVAVFRLRARQLEPHVYYMSLIIINNKRLGLMQEHTRVFDYASHAGEDGVSFSFLDVCDV
jgi:hypothetical protein